MERAVAATPNHAMIAESDTPAFTFALNLNADVSLSAIMETVPSQTGVEPLGLA
jgi:hypothetical protein